MLLSLISEDNHCTSLFVCSYPINSTFRSISESRSGLVIVSPSQKIKLYPEDPLTALFTKLLPMYDTHHVPPPHGRIWESLGPNSPFLCELFHNQSQKLAQLQITNNVLEDCALEAQS